MTSEESRSLRLLTLLKRRGIILPAFEIHGGVAGLFDYGPVGGRLKRKVQQAWLDHWTSVDRIVEIDCPTVTPEEVLKASGHVGAFKDFASECRGCGSVFRSDHLLESIIANAEALDGGRLDAELLQHEVDCPSCGKHQWKPAAAMNLMFPTNIGAFGGGRQAYMRPETAQGMFLLFPALYRHFRGRLPFGAVQVGRGYRNEISPRQGMIRLREFNMAELEYFIDPEAPPSHSSSGMQEVELTLVPDSTGEPADEVRLSVDAALEAGIIRHPTVGWCMLQTHELLLSLGIDRQRMRFRQHAADEMAHYANDCWDCELEGSYGWVECVGIAHRGCYDLSAHESASGSKELRAWREFSEERVLDKEVLSPIGSILGPHFKARAGQVSAALESLVSLPDEFPFDLELEDGSVVSIESTMVERRSVRRVLRGEWFLPHVIEPAFGIDRIIWHILEHAFEETEKEGEAYTILHLASNIAPIDHVVLPLFEKEGMDVMAKTVEAELRAIPGVSCYYDGSKSIGRRYARADEIGVPNAITIDHRSLEDGTVTLRDREDQSQIRISVDELLERVRGRVE